MAKNAGDSITPLPGASRRCPVCGKTAAARHQPFCSPRCSDIDLGRWLKGTYRVETAEGPDDPPVDDKP
jgi:uncharacterized protein